MRKILNRKEQKTLRQSLRNTATTSEKLLWSKLRARKLGGFKFRRQCGIAKYVVDFYCPELNLAIEVDGDVHEEGWAATGRNGRRPAVFLPAKTCMPILR